MSQYNYIKWERTGTIGVLTLNHPEMLNALTVELKEELAHFLDRFPNGEDVRVVIITGAGKAFCAGGDIKRFLKNSMTHQERGGVVEFFSNDTARRLLKVEIPLIAAINGAAVGGGLSISLICDLRIASEAARFGAGFARVGLSPEYGSSFLLARTVGLTKANELILTAKIIDAQEALRIGLVNEVAPPERLLERALAMAREIAALPPFAIRMAKRSIRNALVGTLSQALDYEELTESHCFTSLDHQEALQAFLEKRSSEFRNR